jgi:hypothetical protein
MRDTHPTVCLAVDLSIHLGVSRDAVVLKVCPPIRPLFRLDLIGTQTPNRYLHPDDIPPHSDRTLLNVVTYLSNSF